MRRGSGLLGVVLAAIAYGNAMAADALDVESGFIPATVLNGTANPYGAPAMGPRAALSLAQNDDSAAPVAGGAGPAWGAPDQPVQEDSDALWWLRGFSITPGVGLRHLGLDVTRRSDGYTGNISNSVEKSLFFSLDAETPHFTFGESPFGLSLFMHATTIGLGEQFYEDGGTNPNGTESGNREDVGTSVQGYYSYVVPAVSYRFQSAGNSEFRVALGYGTWIARLSGDVILTPDNRPAPGMTKTRVSIDTTRQAYIFLMSFRTPDNWFYAMTVGGPTFSDSGNDYKVEEVSLTIGKQIVF